MQPNLFLLFSLHYTKNSKKMQSKMWVVVVWFTSKKGGIISEIIFYYWNFSSKVIDFFSVKKRSTISYFALFWYFYSTLFWYILPCAHLGPVNEVRSQLHTECVHFSMQTPWLKQDSSVQWCLVLVLVFGFLDPNFGFLDDFFGFSSWICANYEMDWLVVEREREKKSGGNKYISAIFCRDI